MILFRDPTHFSLSEAAIPYTLVKAARAVEADPTKIYSIAKRRADPRGLLLLAHSALPVLDPTKSLPVLISTLRMPTTSASIRIEELWHEILGLSEFYGSDQNGSDFIDVPSQIKLRARGREYVDQVETPTTAGGIVTVNYPIQDLADVSAQKPGGALTVTAIPNLQTGQVSLSDGGAPIADGIVVQIVYPTLRHCVCILEGTGAVLISKELFDYLSANT